MTEEENLKSEDFYKKWMQEIHYARKREKTFREQAKRCTELYEASTPEREPFAILYSNTETLSPAIYNARPIPIVQRRFKDPDPIGKEAAEVSTRTLKFLIDTDSADYDNFDQIIQPAVTNTLITNRGLSRFKFVAKEDGSNPCVYGEDVRWDKFFHGHARTWKKVPWAGFEHDFTEEEIKANFPEVADKVDFSMISESTEDRDNTSGETKEQLAGVKVTIVYEIWDKISRKVYFFSPCYPKGPLRVVEDPLGLVGFFPFPCPLNLFKKTSTLVPTPLYIQYESQAKELNRITIRLKNLIEALKVRGIYNSAITGIERLLQAEDNTLIPAEEMQSLPDGSGVDKIIWTLPLNDIITTVQQLYMQREQVKQVIYEITGVSDILRGASVASESATAQNLKNQWGTLRLKKMQKEVQRYVRDCLSIMLEIAATKFDIETFQAMTGLQYPTQAQKEQVKQQLEMAKSQAMQQAVLTGQPPALPEPPPEMQKILSTPSWEEILQVLSNDVSRQYKVDIETNSTIDAEAAQDKQDIAELMNAIAQLMNGIGPLVQSKVLPIDVAKNLLLVISRRYTFGPQIEDAIMQMKEPEPESNPADELKMQSEQLKLQGEQARAEAEKEKLQMEMELSRQEHQQKLAMLAAEHQIAMAKITLEREKLDILREKERLKLQASAAQARQKAVAPTEG